MFSTRRRYHKYTKKGKVVKLSEKPPLKREDLVKSLCENVGGLSPYEAFTFLEEYFMVTQTLAVEYGGLSLQPFASIKITPRMDWVNSVPSMPICRLKFPINKKVLLSHKFRKRLGLDGKP